MNSRFSNSESVPALPDFVTVGRVRKPHGIRGEVAVTVLTDIDRRFAIGATVDLVDSVGERQRSRMVSVRRTRSGAIVLFAGVETREDAEALRNLALEVPRDEVPPAPEGSYYFFELIGCDCADRTAGHLGLVSDVVDDGGGLLLEVNGEAGKLLVPFVKAYLRTVDIESRRIEVELPKGLIETCASRS